MNGLIGAGLQLSFFTPICSNSLHLKLKMDFDREILKAVVFSLHCAPQLSTKTCLIVIFSVSGEPTKKAAVMHALQEFIARREQRRVAELFGKPEWGDCFDYMADFL